MLSTLHEQLGQAHGLAVAATAVTELVEERVEDGSLRRTLRRMREDAEVTRERCLEVERGLGQERCAEVLAHVASVRQSGSDLAGAWFKAGTGPLAAWTFLAMGEAGEVAVWRAVVALSEAAPGAAAIRELAAWALPVQERHLQLALDGATSLGRRHDPVAPRWG